MDTRTLDRSPISNFTANGMGILNGNATSFSNVISSIQFACNPYTTSPHSLSFVFLPDEENALALRDCFLQLGLQLPSFLHRVYLLDREFALFSERASTRYPVRSSTDFILHTCNGRDPSYRGLSRCLDIHQALLSLRSRGHHFHPSSQLSLFAPNSLSWSENSRHRHLSMDASRESFSSLFLRSPPNRTSSGASEMSRRSNEATATFPDIHSVTPLLASRALFDGRRIEEDELGDFRLPSSSVDYRRGGMEARLLNSSVDVPSRGSLDTTRHSLDMSHNSLDMSHNSLDIPHTSLESPYRPISFAIDPPSTADYPSLGNDSLQSLFTFHTKPVTSSPLLSVHADYARWSDASPNDLLQPWKTPRTGRMAEELETERRRANSISFLSGPQGPQGPQGSQGPQTLQGPQGSQSARRTFLSNFSHVQSPAFSADVGLEDYSFLTRSSASELSGFELSHDSELRGSSDFKLEEGGRGSELFPGGRAHRKNSLSRLNPNSAEFVPQRRMSREKGGRELLVEADV